LKLRFQRSLLLTGIFGILSLFLAALPGTAFAAPVGHQSVTRPNRIVCNSGWEYNITSHSKVLHVIGATYDDHNGTSHSATETLTSTRGGTVDFSASASVTLEEGVILAKVSETVGVTVSRARTATTSNAITITVPPHKDGFGHYGVWGFNASGILEFVNTGCKVAKNRGRINTFSPAFVGWNTWIGN
jgi:hypothetical protein